MENIASYVSERISDIERILDRPLVSDEKLLKLLAKYEAFAEIEEYLAGGLEEDEEETGFDDDPYSMDSWLSSSTYCYKG